MLKNAFMIMPFGDVAANKAYEHCVQPICQEFDLTIRRADEIFTSTPIYDDIIKEIQEAKIIIADVSGWNPNVFYELGIAHTLKRDETIIITHNELSEAPFDISHIRIFSYKNTIQGSDELKNNLRLSIKTIVRDLRAFYKEQFEIVFEVLLSADRFGDIITLIGIANYPGIIRGDAPLVCEGHWGDRRCVCHYNIIQHDLRSFIHMGYLRIDHNIAHITELGRAFTEIGKEKGLDCDCLDKHNFTPDYVRLHKNNL